MRKIRFPGGFTLVELLVVMAIIAILVGLVLNVAGFVRYKGATARAQAEIAGVSTALESYKADYGDYPQWTNTNTGVTGDNAVLVTNLSPATGKVYFEFTKSQTNSSKYFQDPFGNSYGYQYPGNTNRSGSNFYDLWSTANKPGNSNAWIKNW